jgi:EAL domain-containing protein (putative c-di-GMP-specific phosphodiesterase class I)
MIGRYFHKLSIAFQPIVSVTRNGIVIYGYEALARGAHGVCPPLLMSWKDLRKQYALSSRCQQLAILHAKKLGLQTNLSINVLPGSLLHPKYGLQRFVQFTQDVGFPIDRIILEITEREFVADYKPLRACIDRFRNDGLRIAIDDFGTGFNGLNTLLELQPNIVKIDMTLIHKIETDVNRQALMAGICYGGERLGMRLIAEGVETVQAIEVLSQGNVDLMQGYFFARPQIGSLPIVNDEACEQVPSALQNLLIFSEVGDMTGALR